VNRAEAQAQRRARERAQKEQHEPEHLQMKSLSDDELPRPIEESNKMAKEANDRIINERLERMNAIADSHDELLENDLEDTDGTTIIRDETDEREEQETREAAEAEAAARALQEEGTDEPKRYKLKVNGKEMLLTEDELIARAQKVESADQYLQTASEAVRNASRLAPSKDEPSNFDKDEVRKTLAAAVMGDEEAIDRLASAITRPSISPDALQQIDQRLAFRTELASLEQEQKDLLEDPYLSKLFRVRLQEMQQEAPDTKIAEAYRGIGKELRQAFPEKFKSSTQTKLERKKTLVNVPSASTRQATEADDDGEEDVSDVIQRMAQARHQSQSIKHAKH
jgi:hypothetical protein